MTTQHPSIPAESDRSYALGIAAAYLSIALGDLQQRIDAREVTVTTDGRRLFVPGREILRVLAGAPTT
jgi:hypothetical protein